MEEKSMTFALFSNHYNHNQLLPTMSYFPDPNISSVLFEMEMATLSIYLHI